MKTMTVQMAAEVCGGRLTGCADGNIPLGRAMIDSRAVQPGDLFVAYKGEKTDGHKFINKAFENGAACALAEYLPEDVQGPVILCDSVQTALEKIAEAYRLSLDIPVVGISGSVGKTTAKEMVSAVLSQKFSLLKTDGNLNNQIGVPMTVSRIEAEHEAAVVEMGISGFDEMRLLAKIARPTVAVFTVIGHAHLEFLHDLDGVFKAKTEMLELMDDDAPVIFSGDDEKLCRLASRAGAISCGLGENCMVRAENVQQLADSTICDIVYGQRRIKAVIPAYGQHMVYAALEAAAVGFVMGLSDEQIESGIAAYETVGRRGVVTDTGFVTLVDDSYNANPDSMKCGIDSLVKLPGRRVCIFADMLEMGEDSPRMHYELGQYAREKGVELLLCCGALGAEFAKGAGDRGVHFETAAELEKALPQYLEKGDKVLVKASRGMHLETVAEAIKLLKG